jgi:streptogramin lyase/predicted Ser/Thr protein kinase
MATDQRIGTDLAGYHIERLLGRGGMSAVYLAEDKRLGRKVAIKIPATDLACDPRFRDRFIRESRLAASLEHPNIVPIHEAGEADGVLYIAMRYVRGTDLATLMEQEGPLEPGRAVVVIEQVAKALDAAHAEGLIHRDVKPGNVLIVPAGPGSSAHVYLSDFGLTKRASSDSGMTGTGQFLGTVDYAAPEQFEGKRLDGRADVYSLGCVLHECLAGEPPYSHEREVATMYAHLNEPPPKPSEMRPGVPRAMDAVVAKALAKRPQDRYGSAGDLAAAARRALGEPIAPRLPAKPRRRWWWAAAAGVALVAAVISVVVLVGGGSSPRVGASGSPANPAIPFSQGIVAIDPQTHEIARPIPRLGVESGVFGGAYRGVVASGEGAIWTSDNGTAVRVDPRTGRRTPLSWTDRVQGITFSPGAVWVVSDRVGDLGRIDPATLDVDVIPVTPRADLTSVGFAGGVVWVGGGDGHLYPVDVGTDDRGRPIKVASSVEGLAVGAGDLWVMSRVDSAVIRFDPEMKKIVHRYQLPGDQNDIAFGFGSAWVLDSTSGTVTQIDARSDTTSGPIRTGEGPSDIATGLRSVWVTNAADETITRIAPAVVNRPETIPVGARVGAVAADPSSRLLWVVVVPSGNAFRG